MKRASVISVLLQAGANINHLTRDGLSALNIMINSGHKAIVRLLVSKGAEVGPQHVLNAASKPIKGAVLKYLIESRTLPPSS